MQAVHSIIAEIAATEIPVLLTGESGVGKEAYARLAHRLSMRSDASFKKVTCNRIEEERFFEQLLVDSQTDENSRELRVGTLLLDRIEELDLRCQRLLLSVLADGGRDHNPQVLTARLLSATSSDLMNEVEAGRFCRDLFFRINGAHVPLPPLRKRKDEIPALVEFFLDKYAAECKKKKKPGLDAEAMADLTAYDWPGNIRELENVVRRIVVLSDAQLATSDIRIAPPAMQRFQGGSPKASLKAACRAASQRTEREMILKALEQTHWNRKRAAEELRISYKALLYKLKQIEQLDSEEVPRER